MQRIYGHVVTRSADEFDVLIELAACHQLPCHGIEYLNRGVQESIHVPVGIQGCSLAVTWLFGNGRKRRRSSLNRHPE